MFVESPKRGRGFPEKGRERLVEFRVLIVDDRLEEVL